MRLLALLPMSVSSPLVPTISVFELVGTEQSVSAGGVGIDSTIVHVNRFVGTSLFPASSTALISTVCGPSVEPLNVLGRTQGVKAAPSRLHSKTPR
jgi:hypothetical protein